MGRAQGFYIMTKVLYIGNYRDFSGWGDSAYNNIVAMDMAGIDLVTRPISFSSSGQLRNSILLDKLESKSIKGHDVVIQHVLPNYMSYHGPAKNIGYYATETTLTGCAWHKHINLMDEAWVPSYASKHQSVVSGVNKPIQVVPHGLDIEYYKNLSITADIKELENTYNFCYVGELSKRKNVRAILQAYYQAFHYLDNVNLFLKINMPGLSPSETYAKFKELDNVVRGGFKATRKFKEPQVVTSRLDRSSLLSLMSQCHTFVCASYGEAFCIPAIESMALGLNVITTQSIGLEEFIYKPMCFSVPATLKKCWGATDTISDVYTEHDYWMEINVDELANSMRSAYEFRQHVDKSKLKQHTEQFSLENLGRNIKNLL